MEFSQRDPTIAETKLDSSLLSNKTFLLTTGERMKCIGRLIGLDRENKLRRWRNQGGLIRKSPSFPYLPILFCYLEHESKRRNRKSWDTTASTLRNQYQFWEFFCVSTSKLLSTSPIRILSSWGEPDSLRKSLWAISITKFLLTYHYHQNQCKMFPGKDVQKWSRKLFDRLWTQAAPERERIWLLLFGLNEDRNKSNCTHEISRCEFVMQ